MPSTSRSTSIASRRPDFWCLGRSIWVRSPVTTAVRAEADAGQEHLHLLDRGVLRLVEDHERIVERASAHVGQRRDLDDVLLQQLDHLLHAEHFVQRVVQRAQVGIDLLRQVAGQEAELLAGLDRRAHQDQPLHARFVQRLDRARHGEEGLAGAGRADAEVDVVRGDRVQVLGLVGAAAADRAALDADRDVLRFDVVAGDGRSASTSVRRRWIAGRSSVSSAGVASERRAAAVRPCDRRRRCR